MTRSTGTRPDRRVGAAVGATALACLVATSPGATLAASASAPAVHDAGVWDLAFEKGNRRCRLFLRSEARAGGFLAAMPPACHRAFPLLAKVATWVAGNDEHVVFRDEAGAPVLDFAPNGTAALSADVGEGDLYSLMPIDPNTQYALRMIKVGSATATATTTTASADPPGTGIVVDRTVGKGTSAARQPTAAAAPLLPPVTPAQVVGNYAVLRKDRDTGCMVTLEPTGGRARLAPACRDQGIVVFDPAGWRLAAGELVLTAKRGHSTALTRRDTNVWANAPTRGAALVLKRL